MSGGEVEADEKAEQATQTTGAWSRGPEAWAAGKCGRWALALEYQTGALRSRRCGEGAGVQSWFHRPKHVAVQAGKRKEKVARQVGSSVIGPGQAANFDSGGSGRGRQHGHVGKQDDLGAECHSAQTTG